MTNFFDPQSGEKFFIPNFSLVSRNGSWVHVEKSSRKILTNPATGNILESIPKEGVPEMLKSNNKESRIKMLQDRSKAHFKKEVKEQKYEMNKKLIKDFEAK